MVPGDYYMRLSVLQRCVFWNEGERCFPCQVVWDQTNGYSAVCFCQCSLPLKWLGSRRETCTIKIRLRVVGNAVIATCLFKIDLNCNIRSLGLKPSLDMVLSTCKSLGIGAVSCSCWLLWPCRSQLVHLDPSIIMFISGLNM